MEKNHAEKILINWTIVHMNTLERMELAALDFGIEYIENFRSFFFKYLVAFQMQSKGSKKARKIVLGRSCTFLKTETNHWLLFQKGFH